MQKCEIRSIRLDGVEYPVRGSVELKSGPYAQGAIPMSRGSAGIRIRFAVTPVRALVLRAALAGDERFPEGLETFATYREAHAAAGGWMCEHCPAIGACVHDGDHVMCVECGTWWTWSRDEGIAVIAETRTPAEVAAAARAPVDHETLFAAMRRAEQEMQPDGS